LVWLDDISQNLNLNVDLLTSRHNTLIINSLNNQQSVNVESTFNMQEILFVNII